MAKLIKYGITPKEIRAVSNAYDNPSYYDEFMEVYKEKYSWYVQYLNQEEIDNMVIDREQEKEVFKIISKNRRIFKEKAAEDAKDLNKILFQPRKTS